VPALVPAIEVKPLMRGWLHLGAAPVAAVCGLLLVVLAPPALRFPAVIYAVSALGLFAISATFHRGDWGPKMYGTLRRMDHSTIFVFIAGSYTAFIAAIFTEGSGTVLLWVVWLTALLGVIFRIAWLGAPKWATVPVYLAMGWSVVFYLPRIWHQAGAVIFLLVAVGGLLYTLGALVYGRRRPDPSPKWFGFHEVFHSCTIGGYVSHYIGIVLAFGAMTAV
jgi:hemolysin III